MHFINFFTLATYLIILAYVDNALSIRISKNPD